MKSQLEARTSGSDKMTYGLGKPTCERAISSLSEEQSVPWVAGAELAAGLVGALAAAARTAFEGLLVALDRTATVLEPSRLVARLAHTGLEWQAPFGLEWQVPFKLATGPFELAVGQITELAAWVARCISWLEQIE